MHGNCLGELNLHWRSAKSFFRLYNCIHLLAWITSQSGCCTMSLSWQPKTTFEPALTSRLTGESTTYYYYLYHGIENTGKAIVYLVVHVQLKLPTMHCISYSRPKKAIVFSMAWYKITCMQHFLVVYLWISHLLLVYRHAFCTRKYTAYKIHTKLQYIQNLIKGCAFHILTSEDGDDVISCFTQLFFF